ncbi:MAG: gliding motility-associated ABC transporter substrate-binding protein GldG [Salinivirgaceae bacterium]|nr:gliding motility-associated ABC transporter substrate-binding protein GldG [Salinivirgaceae bacterium]
MRKQLTIETAVKVAILLMIGILSSYFHARFDLTADRRYSLSKPTKQMLSRLDDEILFRVYLDGDLPAGFQRLQNSVREMLDEFRAYGGENIQYEFIDPAENPNQQGRERVFRELYEKGLDPTNLQIKEKDGSTAQKLIFPGIIVSYAGRDVAVNILKNHVSASAEANLQTSIQSLEYDLTFAINQLLTPEAPIIGFLRGHGELTPEQMEDMAYTLGIFYTLRQVDAAPELASTDSAGRLTYRALVVAQPLSRFSDAEKFMIDQYVMAGGRVLWLIDNTTASIDSLSHGREVQAMQLDLNLDDLLFNYGVRINANLVQDMQCAVVPVNTALVGQPPQFAPAPWVFSPIITPAANHPLTKNLDMIRIDFASSIDTVGRDANVAKSILLATSANCRVVPLPARVDLSIIGERIAPEAFAHSGLAVGVLLEGEFRSAFANRPLQVDGFSRQQFRRESAATRMIVISDGDIIRQQFRQNGDQREPLPLGYDRYTRQTFGNKEFLLNAINYLCGFDELMESRSKEFKLRMLNRAKITEQRTTWQMLNVVVPVLIIVAFGFIFNALRKRRYQ